MEEPYAPPPPARPNSGLAIGSLIASILGLFVPFVGSIIGVILGYMAKRQIEESMGELGGEGLAKAGIIVGFVGIGLWVLAGCIMLLVGLGLGGCAACESLQNYY